MCSLFSLLLLILLASHMCSQGPLLLSVPKNYLRQVFLKIIWVALFLLCKVQTINRTPLLTSPYNPILANLWIHNCLWVYVAIFFILFFYFHIGIYHNLEGKLFFGFCIAFILGYHKKEIVLYQLKYLGFKIRIYKLIYENQFKVIIILKN